MVFEKSKKKKLFSANISFGFICLFAYTSWPFINISSWNNHNTVYLPPYEVKTSYTYCLFIVNVINMQNFDSSCVSFPTPQRNKKGDSNTGEDLKNLFINSDPPPHYISRHMRRNYDLLQADWSSRQSWGRLYAPLSPGQRPEGCTWVQGPGFRLKKTPTFMSYSS